MLSYKGSRCFAPTVGLAVLRPYDWALIDEPITIKVGLAVLRPYGGLAVLRPYEFDSPYRVKMVIKSAFFVKRWSENRHILEKDSPEIGIFNKNVDF